MHNNFFKKILQNGKQSALRNRSTCSHQLLLYLSAYPCLSNLIHQAICSLFLEPISLFSKDKDILILQLGD